MAGSSNFQEVTCEGVNNDGYSRDISDNRCYTSETITSNTKKIRLSDTNVNENVVDTVSMFLKQKQNCVINLNLCDHCNRENCKMNCPKASELFEADNQRVLPTNNNIGESSTRALSGNHQLIPINNKIGESSSTNLSGNQQVIPTNSKIGKCSAANLSGNLQRPLNNKTGNLNEKPNIDLNVCARCNSRNCNMSCLAPEYGGHSNSGQQPANPNGNLQGPSSSRTSCIGAGSRKRKNNGHPDLTPQQDSSFSRLPNDGLSLLHHPEGNVSHSSPLGNIVRPAQVLAAAAMESVNNIEVSANGVGGSQVSVTLDRSDLHARTGHGNFTSAEVHSTSQYLPPGYPSPESDIISYAGPSSTGVYYQSTGNVIPTSSNLLSRHNWIMNGVNNHGELVGNASRVCMLRGSRIQNLNTAASGGAHILHSTLPSLEPIPQPNPVTVLRGSRVQDLYTTAPEGAPFLHSTLPSLQPIRQLDSLIVLHGNRIQNLNTASSGGLPFLHSPLPSLQPVPLQNSLTSVRGSRVQNLNPTGSAGAPIRHSSLPSFQPIRLTNPLTQAPQSSSGAPTLRTASSIPRNYHGNNVRPSMSMSNVPMQQGASQIQIVGAAPGRVRQMELVAPQPFNYVSAHTVRAVPVRRNRRGQTSSNTRDQYRNMRLDVDNMSYEQLLRLEERIGNVSVGLAEKAIDRYLRTTAYSGLPRGDNATDLGDGLCSICREEYAENDDLGILDCGHVHHSHCIKKWLLIKNVCPVCRRTAFDVTKE